MYWSIGFTHDVGSWSFIPFFCVLVNKLRGVVIKGYPQWSFSMIFAHFPWLPSGNLT
jgi:hypothetical protein